MSDAKWLALFALLYNAGVGRVRWKFVKDERVFLQGVPEETQLLANRFGDVLPSPYSPFKEIEWLEVPIERKELFANLRASTKAFPWQESPEGLRVVAYEW